MAQEKSDAPTISASDEDAGSYSVGYGKPPAQSRFRPGQSGNPRGKAKGNKALKTLLSEALYETLEVNTARGRKRMSKLAVAIHTMVNNAAKGDAKAREQMFRYMAELGLASDLSDALSQTAAEQLAADDAAILSRFGLGAQGQD